MIENTLPQPTNVDTVARLLAAFAIACAATLVAGQLSIPWLAAHCRERVQRRSAALYVLQRHKAHTPTLGGLFLIGAFLLATLLTANLAHPDVLGPLAVTVAVAVVGAADDLTKLRAGAGLSPQRKLAWQVLLVTPVVACWLCLRGGEFSAPLSTDLQRLPIALTLPGAVLVVLTLANAVNLTDGLDGLASGCVLATLAALIGIGLWQASTPHATTDALAWPSTTPPTLPLAAAGCGAILGFLWFNRFPARVFLGDTGALALGGLTASIGLAQGALAALALASAVLLVELASVVLQVACYRGWGFRPLRCAPLHHHFQLAGHSEPRIVRCFWATSAACALLAVLVTARSSMPRPEHSHATANSTNISSIADTPRVAQRYAATSPPHLPTPSTLGEGPGVRGTAKGFANSR